MVGEVFLNSERGMELDDLKTSVEALRLSLQSQVENTKNPSDSQLSAPTNQTKCQKCEDTGYVIIERERGRRSAVECECLPDKRVQSRLPKRYHNASLLDFSPTIRDFTMNWLSKPADGLLIMGQAGRGKTHLAAALTRTLVLIHQEALFYRAAEFYRSIRQAYRDDTDDDLVIQRTLKYHFLFFDDLGAGSLSDHERRTTLELLDRRLNDNLATCVTTNWGMAEISERMDQRIASRLESFLQLQLDGPDRRSE